jgi:hypothetical protein
LNESVWQGMLSVGSYSEFNELAEERSMKYSIYGTNGSSINYDPVKSEYLVDLGSGGTPFRFGNPDFNFKSLKLNIVYRWEFLPGSAFYFVWTHGQSNIKV